jgi:hypothetical protein
VADDEELSKAQTRREAAERERKSTQEALAVLGSPGADPKLADVGRRFGSLDAQYAEKNRRLNEVQQSKQAAVGELEELSTWFLDAAGKYEDLRIEIQSLRTGPTQLQAEADKIFRDADNALGRAEAAINDPAIQQGLVIPLEVAPSPLEKITAARNELQSAVNAAPRTVTSTAQLTSVRELVRLTSTMAKTIGDARNDVKAANQVRTQAEAVQNVYDETTAYGIVGDRTAEGAAKHEARTGHPVEGRWHGEKCRDYAANLATIIDNLRRQRNVLPKSVHAAIDTAIARAEDRRAKLQEGWEVWNERRQRDPNFGRR